MALAKITIIDLGRSRDGKTPEQIASEIALRQDSHRIKPGRAKLILFSDGQTYYAENRQGMVNVRPVSSFLEAYKFLDKLASDYRQK